LPAPIAQNDAGDLTEKELSLMQGILVDDFLVNDDTTGGAGQWYSSIAMNASGNFVIVWEDARNSHIHDIYFQRYNASSVPQGTNQQANDDTRIVMQSFPSIAMNDAGNFVIAWEDYRNSNSDIFFQRYDSSGNRFGNNQQANDDTSRTSQCRPSVAMDSRGNFVITWPSGDITGRDIYFQRFDSSGVRRGNSQRINDDVGRAGSYAPAIVMDASGNFIVAWGSGNVYVQRYNSDGIRQGNNQKVNDSVAYASDPSIARDSYGNFVIAWTDRRNGNEGIYFQFYNSSGVKQGNNQPAQNDEGKRQFGSSIVMDSSGNFVITWKSERFSQQYNYDIYFQRYDSSGIGLGNNQSVIDPAINASQYGPSIAVDGSGNFVIAWQDDRNGNSDIYLQRYNSSGVRQGNNQQANDDVGSTSQFYPSIDMDSGGNFVTAWQDDPSSNSDLHLQRYSSSGVKQGVNQKVNDVPESGAGHYKRSIALNSSGNFVIAWHDARNGNADVYFQRYNSSGFRQGNNQQANDDGGSTDQFYPSIDMDGSDNFVMVWEDRRNGDGDIYFQRYDSSGSKQGINQKVTDDAENEQQVAPSIAMHRSGSFVIVWNDYRNGSSDIYFQRYDLSGVKLGTNQRVTDGTGSESGTPSIAMDSSGNFVIAWENDHDGNLDIYFQRFDSYGVKLGNNQPANDDTGSACQQAPSIAMDSGGNFVIVWEDYRYGSSNPDVIGQRYYPDGTRRGGNYRIVADGPFKVEQWPVVALNSQQIVFSWMDNRRSKGSDIFAKIATWDWKGVSSVAIQQQFHGDFSLFQNYPNPFNPSTVISYQLPVSSHVELSIFNLLGQKVVTLVSEKQSAGIHQLNWDAKGLASGVYLYRLEAGEFVQVKKLILMR
jgi:hypothetical protein